jgi:hypothetical protein
MLAYPQQTAETVSLNTMAMELTTKTSINNLSPELLLEIFNRCLPFVSSWPRSLESSIFPVGSNPFNAPFILSQVSQHWRHLLLSTPSLWTLINIRLSTRPHLQSHLRYFYTSLKRSGTRQLTVVVTQATPTHLPHHNRIHAALCIAAPRLHTLVVYGSVSNVRALGAALNPERLPVLEAFRCVAPPTPHTAGRHRPNMIDMHNVTLALDNGGPFPNAPRLRSVWIDLGLAPMYRVRVRSANISHLVLSDVKTHFRLGASEVLAVLRACPMLVECTLAVDIWYAGRPVSNGVTPAEQQDATLLVVMQHLRRIDLRLNGALGHLTDKIKAPALEELHVHYLLNSGPTNTRNCYCSLAYFVARASPVLKMVRLEGFLVPLKELKHDVEPLVWEEPNTRAKGLRKLTSRIVEPVIPSTELLVS